MREYIDPVNKLQKRTGLSFDIDYGVLLGTYQAAGFRGSFRKRQLELSTARYGRDPGSNIIKISISIATHDSCSYL